MYNRVTKNVKLYVKLFKAFWQLYYGFWKISGLPHPIVTIFGGSRFLFESKYAKLAHDLAQQLVTHDISVITGGGPGIMAAANCGAAHRKKGTSGIRSIGITVKGIPGQLNMCAEDMITVDYFFVRKLLMVDFSAAFAVFPGGFGTIDELGEVLTLMQTKQLPGKPIVLIGKAYWQPFIQWLQEQGLQERVIEKNDLELFYVTDELEDALDHLKKCFGVVT